MTESDDKSDDRTGGPGECPECGSPRCVWTRVEYSYVWKCPKCRRTGTEYFEDLYGPMSVPWGFLL